MIVNYLIKILHKRAIKFVRENFEYIDDKQIGICHGYQNSRCHWNSYTESRINPDIKVVATMCISPDYEDIMVHFINYDTEKDLYYDLTLGTCNILYKYQYVIGECDFSDNGIENMGLRLGELKHWIIDRSFKNKYIRKFYYWLEDKYNII